MTSRREFLQTAALAGLPVMVGASEIAPAPRTPLPPSIDLHAVLVDERHAQARSVGRRLASSGARVHTIPEGDVTQVWLRQIGPAWRNQPVAVAGLTARPALFCLEQLAFACGLRVVFHGEHVVYPGGQTEHSLLRGAEGAHVSVHDLQRAGRLWPARIAEAVASYGPRAGCPRLGPSNASLEPALPPDAQLLTSWIIAAA
jgi:hypothetical protein